MVYSSCLVFLLCMWSPLKIACNEENATEEENNIPLLRDYKVNIFPGFINITWNCNIIKSMEKYMYRVLIAEDAGETLTVANCFFVFEVFEEMHLTLHKGITVQLHILYSNETTAYIGKDETYLPEGKKNTAANNFSCKIYHVDIMNCSWSVGKEAPEDTQYSLVFRKSSMYVKCQDYRFDSFGRQVGCAMRKPVFCFDGEVYVEVSGLSNKTSVLFFDTIYYPIHDVILDPPRNISLTYNSDELEIKWQKPETHDYMSESCFCYNIIIHKEEINITQSGKNIYKITKFHPNEKVTVTMRVKWTKGCSHYNEWSAWSKPHIIGNNLVQFTLYHILIVVGLCTAIIISVLIFLCYRLRIWKKLFPQVPKPSKKLFDQVEQSEKLVQKESAMEIQFMQKDEEECICANVTENL